MPYKDKEKQAAYDREYRKTHKRKKAVWRTRYYAEHKEEILARHAIYNATHKKENAARHAKYYAEHKEELKVWDAKYRAEHKEEIALRKIKQALRRYYGLTIENYNKMFTAQDGICAICGQPPNGKNLFVDHDHSTDKIRGLLCRSCNMMLGGAKDSIITLTKAIEYLNVHMCGQPI